MTLSQLMTAVRQRADMLPAGYTATTSGTDYFVTDVELVSYINQSYFELYDLLVAAFGSDYFAKTSTFQTDGTNQLFTLPTDFYKLLGVDLQVGTSPSSMLTLKPFEFGERNRGSVPNLQSFYGVTNLRYRLNGANLWLSPVPSGGQTVQLWYVPRMTPLASLGDTMDGISGWTEYVICDAAMKCLAKEESDVSVLMAEKQSLTVRIQAMADTRDQGSPAKVTDARSSDVWGDGGSGGWGES